MASKLAEQMDEMVRDFCKVGPIPKSEVRSRILQYAGSLAKLTLDEMALRVFEDTRERAAKQVTPYRSANDIRRAIRAMEQR